MAKILTDLRAHPELKELSVNPTSNSYKSMSELKSLTNPKLFTILDSEGLDYHAGLPEILLNYDVKYKEQSNELNNLLDNFNQLKQLNGDMMDEKDIQLLKNDLEKSFTAGMSVVTEEITAKIAGLDKRINALDTQAKQTCKDGNCTISAINNLKTDISNMNTANDTKIDKLTEDITGISNLTTNIVDDNKNKDASHDETINTLNEKIGTICTGVDCLTKALDDKNNTVNCPSCGQKFVWDNQTHCPHCGIALEVDD